MNRRIRRTVVDKPTQEVQKYRDNIRVIKLAEAHNDPEIKEVVTSRGEEFVKWGSKNDYYQNLILRYLGSPTNNRCVNGICDLIYGHGLECTDEYEETSKFKQYLEMKRLFNPHEVRRVIQDLKQLGQGTAQVIWNKDKTKILKFVHTPTETWRAAKAEMGTIKKYFYHPNWSKYKSGDKLKSLPTFGHGSKSETIELYIFRPYKSGYYYYSPVDYHGALQYCELEEEVSNYHINNVQNGMQPSMLVNFNNGVPPEEIQELLEQKITDKFAGTSNAGRAIIAFNDDADSAANIEPIHLPDAHAQYQFLSDEAREKIMLGHGVVSPILLGIKDNTGFGNNAEELRTSSILMDNMVIRPFQNIMIDGLKEILSKNSVYLNLYFKTLQPIEFTDVEKIATRIRREEETGEKLSTQVKMDIDDDEAHDLFEQLAELGEEVDLNDWELVHTEVVDDPDFDFDIENFSISAAPNQDSSQDQSPYKVRYAYMPMRKSPDSRDFCVRMEGFTERNVVFRKEDINMMSFRGVNKELGHKRRNYSLFKYKGGKNCHHYWELRVYRSKVAPQDRVSENTIEPVNNPKEVPIRPVDMPGRGAYIK
jgi:hypothetical protein